MSVEQQQCESDGEGGSSKQGRTGPGHLHLCEPQQHIPPTGAHAVVVAGRPEQEQQQQLEPPSPTASWSSSSSRRSLAQKLHSLFSRLLDEVLRQDWIEVRWCLLDLPLCLQDPAWRGQGILEARRATYRACGTGPASCAAPRSLDQVGRVRRAAVAAGEPAGPQEHAGPLGLCAGRVDVRGVPAASCTAAAAPQQAPVQPAATRAAAAVVTPAVQQDKDGGAGAATAARREPWRGHRSTRACGGIRAVALGGSTRRYCALAGRWCGLVGPGTESSSGGSGEERCSHAFASAFLGAHPRPGRPARGLTSAVALAAL